MITLISSLLGLGRTLMHRTVEKSSGEGSLMEQDTIENISLPNFFFKLFNEKNIFLTSFYAKNVFTVYNVVRKNFFAHVNMKKPASRVAKPAKSSPNLNSCSIKISHRATSL